VSDVVEAASFPTRVEADLARLYLESEGVEAVLFDAEIQGLGWGSIVPVRVMVLDKDLPEARRLLRNYKP
jgi:hypothetical protein